MSKLLTIFLVLALSGCQWFSSDKKDSKSRRENGENYEEKRDREDGKLFGDGLEVGGSKSLGIGVNATLWRAALDTVSFMPLSSVDPMGGVIITEWYSPINEPSERFKVDIIILDKTLRPDALRVSLHKQRVNAEGKWRGIEPSEDSVRELEDSILTRARELRRGRSPF